MSLHHNPKIVTDQLILYLDAANPKSYPGSGTTWYDLSGNGNDVTLYNSPTYSTDNYGHFSFDGTNQYARTTSTFDLSSVNKVTVEIAMAKNDTSTTGMAYEQTSNWNNQTGGFGLYPNSTGSATYSTNYHHTNALGFNPMNISTFTNGTDIFVVSKSWTWLNRIQDSHINGNPMNSATAVGSADSTFTDDYFYIGSRGGTSLYHNFKVYYIKVYASQHTDAQALENFNATRGRFGI